MDVDGKTVEVVKISNPVWRKEPPPGTSKMARNFLLFYARMCMVEM